MKHFKYYFALVIAVLMTACSSKDELSQDNSKDPIIISASIAGMQTRSTGGATELQNTAFKDEESVNVYMLYGSGSNNIEGVPVKGYLTYTKDASGWTTADVESIYWPVNDCIIFCGYYPSDVTKDTETFEVKLDQISDADYRASDFMYVYDYYTDHVPVELQFKHMLSKVTVKVNPNGLMTQEKFNTSLYGIELLSISRTASITGEDYNKKANATGNQNSNIYLYWDTTGYNPTNGVSCIVPPQTISEGVQLILVTLNNENSNYYYTVPQGGIKFEAGKEYIFTLSLQKSGVQLSNFTVTDWQPETKTGDAI